MSMEGPMLDLPTPLADLHRHLDGSLRPATVAELAARAGRPVPADLPFSPGMGLGAALSRFAFTLSLLETPEAVRRVAERTAPISLILGKVETFLPVMPVVFLGFRKGVEELRRLHRNLARPPLRAAEAFPFVPHLTLGQDLDVPRLRQVIARSRKLFAAKSISRRWPADCLVVVERCSRRRWIALKPLPLSGPPVQKSEARRRHRGA